MMNGLREPSSGRTGSRHRTTYAYPAGTASMPTTGNTAAQKTGAIVRRPTQKSADAVPAPARATGVADGTQENPAHIRAQRALGAPLQVSHLRDRGSGRVHGFRSTTQSEGALLSLQSCASGEEKAR